MPAGRAAGSQAEGRTAGTAARTGRERGKGDDQSAPLSARRHRHHRTTRLRAGPDVGYRPHLPLSTYPNRCQDMNINIQRPLVHTRRQRRIQALTQPLGDRQLVRDQLKLRIALERLEQLGEEGDKVGPLVDLLSAVGFWVWRC